MAWKRLFVRVAPSIRDLSESWTPENCLSILKLAKDIQVARDTLPAKFTMYPSEALMFSQVETLNRSLLERQSLKTVSLQMRYAVHNVHSQMRSNRTIDSIWRILLGNLLCNGTAKLRVLVLPAWQCQKFTKKQTLFNGAPLQQALIRWRQFGKTAGEERNEVHKMKFISGTICNA